MFGKLKTRQKQTRQQAQGGRGGFNSVADPNHRGVGTGVWRTGGGVKNCPVWGAFLNSPFHSEHFEYTQDPGNNPLLPSTTNEK